MSSPPKMHGKERLRLFQSDALRLFSYAYSYDIKYIAYKLTRHFTVSLHCYTVVQEAPNGRNCFHAFLRTFLLSHSGPMVAAAAAVQEYIRIQDGQRDAISQEAAAIGNFFSLKAVYRYMHQICRHFAYILIIL